MSRFSFNIHCKEPREYRSKRFSRLNVIGLSSPKSEKLEYLIQRKKIHSEFSQGISTSSVAKKKRSKVKKINIAHLNNGPYKALISLLAEQHPEKLVIESGYTLSRSDLVFCTQSRMNSIRELRDLMQNQRINFFPFLNNAVAKNALATSLNLFAKMHPVHYKFYPETFVLPREAKECRRAISKNENAVWIVKPAVGQQGKGITLHNSWEDLRRLNSNLVKKSRAGVKEEMIVQKYLNNPMLLSGLKFDMRIYVLLTDLHPMKAHLFRVGLARFATKKFQKAAYSNLQVETMHLTNYSVQKHSKAFKQHGIDVPEEEAHKRTIATTIRQLQEVGYPISEEKFWKEVGRIVSKTLAAMWPRLWEAYHFHFGEHPAYNKSKCFQLLGFDIIMDGAMKLWVLEVNSSPSLNQDSPVDAFVNRSVLRRMFEIRGILNENDLAKSGSKIAPSDDHFEQMIAEFHSLHASSEDLDDGAHGITSKRLCDLHESEFRTMNSRTSAALSDSLLPEEYPACNDLLGIKAILLAKCSDVLNNLRNNVKRKRLGRKHVPFCETGSQRFPPLVQPLSEASNHYISRSKSLNSVYDRQQNESRRRKLFSKKLVAEMSVWELFLAHADFTADPDMFPSLGEKYSYERDAPERMLKLLRSFGIVNEQLGLDQTTAKSIVDRVIAACAKPKCYNTKTYYLSPGGSTGLRSVPNGYNSELAFSLHSFCQVLIEIALVLNPHRLVGESPLEIFYSKI